MHREHVPMYNGFLSWLFSATAIQRQNSFLKNGYAAVVQICTVNMEPSCTEFSGKVTEW